MRPRITVQFEITGEESDQELAKLKRLEREAELKLAAVFLYVIKDILRDTSTSFTGIVIDRVGQQYKVTQEDETK